MQRTPVVVYEGNDPAVRFTLTIAGTDGDPYQLTGSPSVEFYLKNSSSESDASPKKKYSTGTGEISITDAAGGVLSIQMAAADLTPAGKYFYHLDIIRASKRETLVSGDFQILDI